MNHHRFARSLIPLLAALLLAPLSGCDADEMPPVGTARLPLTADMVAAADVLFLFAEQGDERAVVWQFPDPDDPDADEPREALFDLPPGRYDRLVLEGSVAGRPLYLGQSADFEVTVGEDIVVRVVVDPFGRLVVAPLGLDLLDGVGISITPRAPLPGDPPSYPLASDGDGFRADVPIGTYDVQIDLPLGLDGLITLDALEAEVLTGGVITLRPAFGPPDAPPPLPIVADVLDLALGGVRGLLGTAVDISLRALDDDGRVVADYAGEVAFEARVLEVGGLALGDLDISLPLAHRFDPEADGGARIFLGGLLVGPVVQLLATVRLEITAVDAELGIESSAEICLRGLLGGC